MTRIWVEGREDEELVEALLDAMGLASGVEVRWVGGWAKLRLFAPDLRKSMDEGGKNLIVFDADAPPAGGAVTRRAAIQAEADALGVPVAIFLLPDDTADGEIEDLMVGMVPVEHAPVMTCFDGFEACLSGLPHPDPTRAYVVELAKTRTYSYVGAMPLTAEQQKRREHPKKSAKFFDDPEIWDLDAAAVQPLRQFLSAHLP